MPPKRAAPRANVVSEAALNARLRYRRMSSSGCSTRRARSTNSADQDDADEERDQHPGGGERPADADLGQAVGDADQPGATMAKPTKSSGPASSLRIVGQQAQGGDDRGDADRAR